MIECFCGWLGALGLLPGTPRFSSSLNECRSLAPKAALLLEVWLPGGFGPCPLWLTGSTSLVSCHVILPPSDPPNPVHTLATPSSLLRPHPTSSVTSTVCTNSAAGSKTCPWDQRDGAAVKSVCCSSRRPEFGSENPCQAT